MRVAAYQAPLLPSGSFAAIELIRAQIKTCESKDVEILCCPEAILGGLADYALRPSDFAIDADNVQLAVLLAPLESRSVTCIVGFTQIEGSRLYNAAGVFLGGRIVGLYRKTHPAINKSVYEPGDHAPTFTVGGLKFGIIICNDSNFVEPARTMVEKGAAAIFVPTNNGMPENRGPAKWDSAARTCDLRMATEYHVPIVRADVAGRCGNLVSAGCSAITDSDGTLLQSAPPLREALLIAEIAVRAT